MRIDLEGMENAPHAVWCNQFDPAKSEMCSCHKLFAAPLIAELRLARDCVELLRWSQWFSWSELAKQRMCPYCAGYKKDGHHPECEVGNTLARYDLEVMS